MNFISVQCNLESRLLGGSRRSTVDENQIKSYLKN